MRRAWWLAGLGGALLGLAALLWAVWPRALAPKAKGARAGAMVTLSDPLLERPSAKPGAPNLVLIIGCTVRRDQTSLYGGPPETTPFLASLAREGAKLEDLVSAAPWTRAASTAILTGRHPLAVGMADPNPGREERKLAPAVVTLAEHLRAQGYTTLGLTTNPNLNSIFGFEQGFDAYRQLVRLWRDNGLKLAGSTAVREMLALLDEHRDGPGPFYLQLVLIDAHAPYSATGVERARFADPSVPDRVVAYRAMLARLDATVAQFHDALEERGFDSDNTVFVFVNDHGDGLSFPEHHGSSHGRYLAPSSVGGVFVATGPGVAPGQLVHGVASQVDLAPTLTALLGLAPFPGEGRDLSAALRGLADQTGRDRAYTDTWFKEASRSAIYTDTTACQLDFDPQGESPFVDGCFDRAADPLHAHPTRDPALEEDLRAWRAARLAEGSAFEATVAKPDRGTEEQLQALGYLE